MTALPTPPRSAPTSSSSAPARPGSPPATTCSGSGSTHGSSKRTPAIGDIWRRRYDSLKLYSPASYDSLPGMPFPLPKRAFPTGREMADYLELYAGHFGLTVDTGVRIERLEAPAGEGEPFVATAGDRRYEAGQVIVAAGPFQRPRVPAFATELDPAIRQLHSSDYRNPSQLADGPVLVVGLSHSGADLAHEIAASHPVILSGKSHGQIPVPLESRRGLLGFSVFQAFMWHVATLDTPIGRKMAPEVRKGGGPLLRWRKPELKAAGVELTDARTTGVVDGKPVLADGRVLDVANVLWCTGFWSDYSWIRPPIKVDEAWLAGAVPRGDGCARPVLHGRALPVLVHVDAHPRRRPGCRVRRGPHRRAGGRRGAGREGGRGHGLTLPHDCSASWKHPRGGPGGCRSAGRGRVYGEPERCVLTTRPVLLAFAVFVVFAGANATAVKVVLGELPPFWSAGLRFVVAGAAAAGRHSVPGSGGAARRPAARHRAVRDLRVRARVLLPLPGPRGRRRRHDDGGPRHRPPADRPAVGRPRDRAAPATWRGRCR